MIRTGRLLAIFGLGCFGGALAFAGTRSPPLSASASPLHAALPVKPQHIMSINMCDDLLLLLLVPKTRIASITYLAHDAVTMLMPGRDAGIAVNHGLAEEVLQQKPDLILSSPWTTPVVRQLARQVGVPVVEVEDANDFKGIRDVLRQVGAAVGEPERAEALIRKMDADLERLKKRRTARPLRVVAWTGSGSVPGRGTLTDAIIMAAGGTNIGAKRPDAGSSNFGLEELLVAKPDAILQGIGGYDPPSLHESSAHHPLITRLFAGRQITYPEAGYSCGLPQSADAARTLADAFASIPQGAPRW